MWHANVTRRQLLELFLAGEIPKPSEVHDFAMAMEGEQSSFDVFWIKKPAGGLGALPTLIVVDDRALQEAIAMLSSSSQVPSPLTAFCRFVPRSLVPSLKSSVGSVRPEIALALTGVSLAEAVIYSGGSIRLSDVSPAACKRTLAFVYGRALTQLPVDALPLVVSRWLDTQSILGVSPPIFERVSKALTPVLNLAARVFLGFPPDDVVSAVASEIIEFGEPSEEMWAEMSGERAHIPSLKFFAEATREERSSAFQDVLRSLYSKPAVQISEEAVAACALAGTRISPGTLDHLNLLVQYSDVRLPLWYAFFASLQRQGSALRANSGAGLRVMRDMSRQAALGEAPVADISSEELKFAFRANLEHLSRKLGHANEILVELFPGLEASFRFGSKGDRKEAPPSEAPAPPREKTLVEKIDATRKLLDDLSRDLARFGEQDKPAKTSKRRASKPNRLL